MIDIQIGDRYPTRWSRREPDGLFLPVRVPPQVRKVQFSMEGDGAGPFTILLPDERDRQRFRGAAWKPEINGDWWPLVKAFETFDGTEPIATKRGPHKVHVNEDLLDHPYGDSLTFPIRAPFYYPWFETADSSWWNAHTHWHPIPYQSSDPDVIDRHIAAMQYGGFHAGISSWWGQGPQQPTDVLFPLLLARANGTTFKWCIYHEREGSLDPSIEQLRDDLLYIKEQYATHPNYLRVGGKFVVFVYSANDADCNVALRWKQANTFDAHIVLKVFGGYALCSSLPDGWHEYGPSHPALSTLPHCYNISPGFVRKADSGPLLERSLSRWKGNISDMIASGARWQLVTSLNEWGEGTAIESASEWESESGHGAYLDALHAAFVD